MRSARELLRANLCLLPSTPSCRRRNGNLDRPRQSPQRSVRFIPSPKSMPTSPFATNCFPKRNRLARRQSSQAQLWQMILSWAASNQRGHPTRRNVCPKRTPFGNANVAKPSASGSLTSAVRPLSSILITASPTPVRLAPRTLVPAPQHCDGRRQTPAHVEGEITFRVWNLPLTGLFGQVLISFNHLSHAGRSNRMSVAD